jgi:hypothetical protein
MTRQTEGENVGHALPDDDKILAAIGTIALRHGQLDNALRMTIGDLTGVEKTESLDATARDGSRELRDRIRRLARKRLGEGTPLVRLQAILTRAARATDKRNELLHAVWGTELDGGPIMRGDDHKFRPPPSVLELEALHEEIARILIDLIDARFNGFLFEALKR